MGTWRANWHYHVFDHIHTTVVYRRILGSEVVKRSLQWKKEDGLTRERTRPKRNFNVLTLSYSNPVTNGVHGNKIFNLWFILRFIQWIKWAWTRWQGFRPLHVSPQTLGEASSCPTHTDQGIFLGTKTRL